MSLITLLHTNIAPLRAQQNMQHSSFKIELLTGHSMFPSSPFIQDERVLVQRRRRPGRLPLLLVRVALVGSRRRGIEGDSIERPMQVGDTSVLAVLVLLGFVRNVRAYRCKRWTSSHLGEKLIGYLLVTVHPEMNWH